MLRTTDKSKLTKGHYKDDNKLLFRKKYNSFTIPSRKLTESLLTKIKEIKAENILDVGCGNGDFLINIRKSGFSNNLFGLELSEGMLKKGIEQNKEENLNINLSVGDIQDLPFNDQEFDIIIAKHMLYHVPDIKKGIAEVGRCLKKDGTFIITLNSEDNKPLLFECEKIICKKYNLYNRHGQDIVNVENVNKFLEDFKDIQILKKEGTLDKPELFTQYFATFRDNYEPYPNDNQWKQILGDVDLFVKEKLEKEGSFIEKSAVGMIIAIKR